MDREDDWAYKLAGLLAQQFGLATRDVAEMLNEQSHLAADLATALLRRLDGMRDEPTRVYELAHFMAAAVIRGRCEANQTAAEGEVS